MSDQEKLDLRAAIDALVPKILELRHEQIPEEQTKQTLIAPVLTALGWQIHESGEVRYEYKANPQCNPVDYGLMVHGKTVLVIEAKKLGRDLNTEITQLFGNLGVAGGVHWGVLTDGDIYRVYRVTGDGGASEKLFFDVSITEDAETASKMLNLLSRSSMACDPPLIDIEWRTRLLCGYVKAVIQEMLDGTDAALVRSVCRKHPQFTAEAVAAALSRLEAQVRDRGAAAGEPPPARTIKMVSGPNAEKPKRESGYDVFCGLIDNPIARKDLISQMVAQGFKVSTAQSYIQWAKRTVEEMADKPGYCRNPFFVEIEVYKDGNGITWVRRKPGRDFRHEWAGNNEDMKTWRGK